MTSTVGYETSIFHAKVRWLSSGKFTMTMFQLRMNLQSFCLKQKYHYPNISEIICTFAPCMLLLSKFFLLPNDAQENCFQRRIKTYIKIKIAPTLNTLLPN